MESASWQRPLYGLKINRNQAETPLKSGVLGRPEGGVTVVNRILCIFARKIRLKQEFNNYITN